MARRQRQMCIRDRFNGGRYDQLISDLGSKKKVPAVGAAINLK